MRPATPPKKLGLEARVLKRGRRKNPSGSLFDGDPVLDFGGYRFERLKYTEEECRDRDYNYSAALKVKVRLVIRETGEIKEQEVFMGDFPLMTERGTFIINGAERVVVSQLVRSPGVYFSFAPDTAGRPLPTATVIPHRGAWLELEADNNKILYTRIDRTRKIAATVLLRAVGYESNEQIQKLYGDDPVIKATLDKDNSRNQDEALIEIFRYLSRLVRGETDAVDDDIDHLGNRRVRSVGELLQNQFRIGMLRMERVIRERMTIQDTAQITPQVLINIRPVVAAIKEFFGSSQLYRPD